MARKLALATNPKDISFIPETCMVEGDNFLQQRVLWNWHIHHSMVDLCSYLYKIYKCS